LKKYLLSTICLMLLIFWPGQAQDTPKDLGRETGGQAAERNIAPERFTTISETNYLNELALRGFNLDTQGLLIESLDGNTVYGKLNSSEGFNPASVTKVATSFTALHKLGPDYHFETAFYIDGVVNAKTRTLNGDLILSSSGDPVLSATDLTKLVHQLLTAGIARVTGNLVYSGPFTYNAFLSTDIATKRMDALVRKMGIRFTGSERRASVRGTKVAAHSSASLRDIIFVQNAHSVNQTAERLGEAVGGPKAVERFLVQEVGLAPSEVSLTHTSGLEFNRITPHGTVALMRHLVAWLNLHNMLPEDVMPVAGVDPGTLHARFTSEDSRGAIVAKTGTLPGTDGGVSTLAGIVYTRDRGPILFAIFNSRGSVTTYRRMQDNLLKDLIAECGGQSAGATRKSGN
jgi:serine-type D-Ala-D-Ala carboxypeptidase/endopeptidase (penicillin-binding protein 4)